VLTSTRVLEFEATHVLMDLPSWHVCARMHGHQFQVAVHLTFPEDEVEVDTVLAVTIAVAELEDRLLMSHLNELVPDDGDKNNADEQWLAGFVHDYIARSLPQGGAERLAVFVRHPALPIARRWPAAAPGERVDFPELPAHAAG
jgi:6-pyruvoyltetrahydropterin/6-carboxytetrahydropterin synthase